MTSVKQYNCFACFPACLESFLADQGQTTTQKEIVARFASYHHEGEDKEGCFGYSKDRLEELGGEYRFDVEILTAFDSSLVLSAKEAIFLLALEFGPKKTQHCVRFIQFVGQTEIEIMNPCANAAFPDKWGINEARKWQCILIKLKAA